MNIGWKEAKGLSKFKELIQQINPNRHKSLRYSTFASSSKNNNKLDLSMITESAGTPQISRHGNLKTTHSSNE